MKKAQGPAAQIAARRQAEVQDGLRHAHGLSCHLRVGGALPRAQSGMLLDYTEIEHTRLWANVHGYYGLDNVQYQRSFFAAGGIAGLIAGAAASAVINDRRKSQAFAHAAPQWRPHGQSPIVVTSQRLLMSESGQWLSLWYGAMRHMSPDLASLSLHIQFEGSPPLRLTGPSVPYLSVVVVYIVKREVLTVPAHLIPGVLPPPPPPPRPEQRGERPEHIRDSGQHPTSDAFGDASDDRPPPWEE